ncbi:MAG: hypothetical protein IJV82_01595 [Oscillospiraceae bacterium]|nr:hypothetical protein [Oscillospiraceae bacterium]
MIDKVFALALLAAVILAGCASPKSQNTETTTAPTESSALETAPTTHVCSLGWLRFEGYEYDRYVEHFRTAEYVPENFVYYEQIQALGTFRSIDVFNYHSCHPTAEDYDVYLYDLLDDSGFNVLLKVLNREEKPIEPQELLTDVKAQNMRELPRGDKVEGVYVHNGIRYHYSNMTLERIEWYANGLCFQLFGNDDLYEYSREAADTFTSRLLSLETADDAIADFAQRLCIPPTAAMNNLQEADLYSRDCIYGE